MVSRNLNGEATSRFVRSDVKITISKIVLMLSLDSSMDHDHKELEIHAMINISLNQTLNIHDAIGWSINFVRNRASIIINNFIPSPFVLPMICEDINYDSYTNDKN